MNNNPQFSKRCYRCPNLVRMTPEEFRAAQGPYAEETCCPICRDKTHTEARFAGERIPADALTPPAPWRMSAWDSDFPKESDTPTAQPTPTA